MTDYLIVGRGLAATVLMHEMHARGLSFRVIGEESLSNCSRIAAGIWHPVVFKRLTKSWMADELIPHLMKFYKSCEKKFGKTILTGRRLIRPFGEQQEKELWKRKAALELRGYLEPELIAEPGPELKHCRIPLGYGIVKQCGNLDVALFLDLSAEIFREKITTEIFDHSSLQINTGHFTYGDISARNIVFCEGWLVQKNPFFKWVPLRLAKGELLKVNCEKPVLQNEILNKNGFLIDLADGSYKLGATYEWEDMDSKPTEVGLKELNGKLESMINCSYKVLKHEAGLRPSSIDRRPVIGKHPAIPGMYVFNGLGTKGVMLAPLFAANFVNFCQQSGPLHPEVDVGRFYSLYDAGQ